MTPAPPASTVVAPTPPATAPETPPAPPAAPPAPPPVSKEEFEALKAQIEEHKRTAQFWYDKANQKQEAPKPAAPAAEPEEDILDIVTKGPKAFDEFMRKRGYAKVDEVDSKVNAKAAALQAEQELYASYPELKNTKSEFFTATAMEYGALVKEGVPESAAMRLAADRVALREIQGGKRKTPAQISEDEKAAKAAERAARAAAQSGDRGGRPAEGSEEDEELTPEQKHIISAMGISEEAYKKRAKEGVRMAAKMR